MKITKLIVLLVILCPTVSFGMENAGSYLDMGAGAVPMAFGNSYGASEGDVWESYYNPAGIYGMITPVVASTYQTVFIDTNFKAIGIGIPLPYATVAAHYFTAGVNSIPETEIDENTRPAPTGKQFNYLASVMTLSIARELYHEDVSAITAGFNLRYLEETLWANSATGFGADVGVIYSYAGRYRFGLSLLNLINPEMVWDTPAGTRERVPVRLVVAFEYTSPDDIVRAKAALQRKNYFEQTYHLGIQYRLLSELNIRAGICDGQVSTGVGLVVGTLDLDYALIFARDEEIGILHRMSLGWRLPLFSDETLAAVTFSENCEPIASAEKNYSEAEELTNAVFQPPTVVTENMYEETLQRAHIAYIHEQYDEAASLYNQVIAMNGNEPIALNKLGDIFAAEGNYRSAREFWEQALKYDPDNLVLKQKIMTNRIATSADLLYNRGYLYFSEGDYQKACDYYQKTISADPAYQKAYLWLGNSYMMLGKSDLARQAWSLGGEYVREEAERFYNQGYVSLQQNNLDQAASNYERALELAPDYEQAYLWLGIVRLRQNNVPAALEVWDRGIQRFPESKLLHEKLTTYSISPDPPVTSSK